MKSDADKVKDFATAVYAALNLINEAQNKRIEGGRVNWMNVTAAVTEELHWALGVNDLPQEPESGK